LVETLTDNGPMAGIAPATGRVLWSGEQDLLKNDTALANEAVISGGGSLERSRDHETVDPG